MCGRPGGLTGERCEGQTSRARPDGFLGRWAIASELCGQAGHSGFASVRPPDHVILNVAQSFCTRKIIEQGLQRQNGSRRQTNHYPAPGQRTHEQSSIDHVADFPVRGR
jgi:hypothetical protein